MSHEPGPNLCDLGHPHPYCTGLSYMTFQTQITLLSSDIQYWVPDIAGLRLGARGWASSVKLLIFTDIYQYSVTDVAGL